MIVDFKNIPLDSRIWVYQSCIDFNENQVNIINEKCTLFLKNWKAHGNDLESSFLVKNNRFIIAPMLPGTCPSQCLPLLLQSSPAPSSSPGRS